MRPAPGERSKQFRVLGGEPVLVHSLAALAACPLLEGAVVVVPSSEVESVRQSLSASRVAGFVREVVVGGETRQRSVSNGVAASPADVPFILVHDAVRPFVHTDDIAAVVRAIQATGAAGLAVPVADTLRQSDGQTFAQTVDREGLWRMQTPQGARRALLLDALAQAEREGWQGTDEVGLLQRAGVHVTLVPGDERNIKLTRPADWRLAEALWASL